MHQNTPFQVKKFIFFWRGNSPSPDPYPGGVPPPHTAPLTRATQRPPSIPARLTTTTTYETYVLVEAGGGRGGGGLGTASGRRFLAARPAVARTSSLNVAGRRAPLLGRVDWQRQGHADRRVLEQRRRRAVVRQFARGRRRR